MLEFLENRPVLSIFLLTLVMLCFSINHLDVTIMEARNFITAREMVTDGNWILTTMNGEARYEKPPLPTWFAAFSGLLFGLKNTLALRIPGILMIAVLGTGIYWLSQQLGKTNKYAFVNALIAITSFYVIGIVIEAPWDIFTHSFMLIGILYLFKLFELKSIAWNYVLAGSIFVGLSILSKGPISIYALLLPFLIAYGISFGFRNIHHKWVAILVFLIIAMSIGGWWYAYVRLEDTETFLKIASKETGNWGSYNVRPFYYYWSFFIQSGIWTIPAFIGLLYPYMKSRVSNIKGYRLSFYWTILAVILLSIIPEKKSRYLMPVLIPLALNTGYYIEYLIKNFKDIKDKRELIPVYFNFSLIGLLGVLFPIIGYFIFKNESSIDWITFSASAIVLFFIGIQLFKGLKTKNIKSVFYLTVLFMVLACATLLPLSSLLKNADYKSVATINENHTDYNELPIYGINLSPETIWHYGKKIESINNDDVVEFPTVSSFRLLASQLTSDEKKQLDERFSIRLIETYDLNTSSPETRSHRKRLVSHLYVLSKK